MPAAVPGARSCLDGHRCLTVAELDSVGPAEQVVGIGPHGETSSNLPSPLGPGFNVINPGMDDVADRGRLVLGPQAVEVDQRPLAGAVGVVLDLAEGDDIAVGLVHAMRLSGQVPAEVDACGQ